LAQLPVFNPIVYLDAAITAAYQTLKTSGFWRMVASLCCNAVRAEGRVDGQNHVENRRNYQRKSSAQVTFMQ